MNSRLQGGLLSTLLFATAAQADGAFALKDIVLGGPTPAWCVAQEAKEENYSLPTNCTIFADKKLGDGLPSGWETLAALPIYSISMDSLDHRVYRVNINFGGVYQFDEVKTLLTQKWGPPDVCYPVQDLSCRWGGIVSANAQLIPGSTANVCSAQNNPRDCLELSLTDYPRLVEAGQRRERAQDAKAKSDL